MNPTTSTGHPKPNTVNRDDVSNQSKNSDITRTDNCANQISHKNLTDREIDELITLLCLTDIFKKNSFLGRPADLNNKAHIKQLKEIWHSPEAKRPIFKKPGLPENSTVDLGSTSLERWLALQKKGMSPSETL